MKYDYVVHKVYVIDTEKLKCKEELLKNEELMPIEMIENDIDAIYEYLDYFTDDELYKLCDSYLCEADITKHF